MPFRRIPITKLDRESVDRNLQKIEVWSDSLEQPSQIPVKPVTSQAQLNQYQVTNSDVYLIVDARNGPMKIVFPSITSNQVVNVLNAYGGHPVTVVRSNGKSFDNAPAVVTLENNESAKMVSNGKGWFRFGRGA